MKKSGAFFDNQNTLHIPGNVPGPGDLDPKLNVRQWFLWIILSAENKRNDYGKWTSIFDNGTTHWRDKNRLIDTEYI